MSVEISPVVKSFTQEDVNRYADAVNDHNPVHLDEEFAKKMGLDGTILHGGLVMAGISEMMTIAFGEDWITRGKLSVRFKLPARPGDIITHSAKPQGEKFLVESRNQRDELLIRGTAEIKNPA